MSNSGFCIPELPDVNVFHVTTKNRASFGEGESSGALTPSGKPLRPGWYWAQFYPYGFTQGPFG
jgi:hypothetical protein